MQERTTTTFKSEIKYWSVNHKHVHTILHASTLLSLLLCIFTINMFSHQSQASFILNVSFFTKYSHRPFRFIVPNKDILWHIVFRYNISPIIVRKIFNRFVVGYLYYEIYSIIFSLETSSIILYNLDPKLKFFATINLFVPSKLLI